MFVFNIAAYRYHLSMDPNPDVRRTVLNNIAISFQTLPDLLERTRDVRDIVRRHVSTYPCVTIPNVIILWKFQSEGDDHTSSPVLLL